MRLVIIDGYNVVYGSPRLKLLLSKAPFAAQQELIEGVLTYAVARQLKCILVFDAHTRGQEERWQKVSSLLSVVWTARGVTADSFIEAYISANKKQYAYVYLITSDLAQGFTVLDSDVIPRSPQVFLREVHLAARSLLKHHTPGDGSFAHHLISGPARQKLRDIRRANGSESSG